MENSFCPNCKSEIKLAFFSSSALSKPETVTLINDFGTGGASGYCMKCEGAFLKLAVPKYKKIYDQVKGQISTLIEEMPIITVQNPLGWDYQIKSIVTAQSVLGTGVFAEFTSSFTDLFGSQSGAYNSKIVTGENFCKNILRKKALELGCNAIIGTDIDYSEAGGAKGMLMVCMAGTAVKLRNPEICGADKEKLQELTVLSEWWEKYNSIYIQN